MTTNHFVFKKTFIDATQANPGMPNWAPPSDFAGPPNLFGIPGMFAVADAHAATAPTAPDGAAMALYLSEPGATAQISMADLYQGGLADCFLISSIGELARTDPREIRSMIHQNSNGTETVTLHVAANGSLPSPDYSGVFTTATEVVTNSFPSNSVDSGAGQDVVNGVKEIWPQVLENAVAQLNGGYANIAGGGYPFVAMEELTGIPATWLSLPEEAPTLGELQGFNRAGDMLTFDTISSPTDFGLVGNHSYMFEGLSTAGGTPLVHLGNPWGTDQPAAIPISKLSSEFAQIDIGHFG